MQYNGFAGLMQGGREGRGATRDVIGTAKWNGADGIGTFVVAVQPPLCYTYTMDYSTISDETRKLIETTVREHLVGYDVAPCNIELVDDEPGTVGISVGICYDSAGPPIHPKLRLALLSDLRRKLVACGDWRMPFVEHYFAIDQKFEGLRRAC
jgi:hypothetical protein